jgi:bacterioferritin-associated ferredoxin
VGKNQKKGREIICFCNNVPRDVIEEAIKSGCQTLNEIYDKTMAGVGPCGGSCRRKIAPILEEFLATGKFAAGSESEKQNLKQKPSED